MYVQLYQNKGEGVHSLSSLYLNMGLFFVFFLWDEPLIKQKQEEDKEEKEQSMGGRKGEWVGADRVKPNRIKCNLA